ncbi:MAG: polysaccharide lyase, partial [Planctomycetota bacterium]
MNFSIPSFCLFMAAVLSCQSGSLAQVIYSNNFEDDPTGTYSAANLNADWNSPPFSNGVDEGRVTVVNEEHGKCIRVLYPSGLYGSGDDDTGAQWKLEFGQGYEAVELEYRVKFGTGFDFVRGGKLPGLIGGAGNVGGNVPNGTDGFSARMMWRTDGSSGSSLPPEKANIVQYVYHPDQPGTFGEDFRWDDGQTGDWMEFESDRWYHLRHRVVMNTPGQSDGVIMAWLDGELVLVVDNIRFRDVSTLQIDQFYFSTFFGGGSSIWATTKDEYAFFDDFRITAVPQDPLIVSPDSFMVTRGTYRSGGIPEIEASDNNDLSIQRNSADVQSRCEFEVKAVSPITFPGHLDFTLESSVFARSLVNQNISLFNFETGAFETIYSRAASRFGDSVTTISVGGDVSRFVEPATNFIEARISYVSASPRQRFTANVDLVNWIIAEGPQPDMVPRAVLYGGGGQWPICYKLSEYYDAPDVNLINNPDHEVTEQFEAGYDENGIPVIKSFVIWSGDGTSNSSNPRVELQMKPECAVDAYNTDMCLRIRSRVMSLSPMGPNATKPFETVTLGQIH